MTVACDLHEGYLVVRVTEAKPERHAIDASGVQSLRTGEQHPADLVERIVFATAVA